MEEEKFRTEIIDNEHLKLLSLFHYIFGGIILAYAFFTYVDRPPQIKTLLSDSLSNLVPTFEVRRWMMVTIPLVVYGVSRYAQLLYVREEGERPEKIVTTDKPLIITMFLWGLMVIGIIYLF